MATNFKDTELLEFINKKKMDAATINEKKVFFIFIKILCNTLYSSYVKLQNVGLSISCSEMIFSIFWIIFQYTLNLKLSMFLCERGVILFVEYINLSSDLEEGIDKINMVDVKLFIYKKTLGPLVLHGTPRGPELESVYTLTLLMKHFVQSIFTTHAHLTNLNTKLECVCSSLGATVYKMFQAMPRATRQLMDAAIDNSPRPVDLTERQYSLTTTDDPQQFKKNILLLKLKLEVLYYGHISGAGQDTIKRVLLSIHETVDVSFPRHVLDGSTRLIESGFFKEFIHNKYLEQ